MKNHKENIRKNKVIVATVFCVIFILVAGFLYIFMNPFSQISPDEAQKRCEALFEHVKTQINSVPGYKIVSSNKSCDLKKDEVGQSDYVLAVSFLVSKDRPSNTTAEIKANVDYLISQLPYKNHWLWYETLDDYTLRVGNEPQVSGQPATYCIDTARYLDNNGQYIEQSPGHYRGGYVEPGSSPGYDPCANNTK